jgi:hypothetical protein
MWLYLISMAVASILAFQASRMQKPGDAGWWLAVVVEAALVAASVAVAVGTAAVARLNGAVWPCLILFFLATDDRRARRPIAE